jgi:hypothetical protein
MIDKYIIFELWLSSIFDLLIVGCISYSISIYDIESFKTMYWIIGVMFAILYCIIIIVSLCVFGGMFENIQDNFSHIKNTDRSLYWINSLNTILGLNGLKLLLSFVLYGNYIYGIFVLNSQINNKIWLTTLITISVIHKVIMFIIIIALKIKSNIIYFYQNDIVIITENHIKEIRDRLLMLEAAVYYGPGSRLYLEGEKNFNTWQQNELNDPDQSTNPILRSD